jgi:protein-S-isoprenylcysteine O-methyltransferase Ste14
MAVTDAMVSQAMKGRRHERVISLWPLGPGTRKFGGLYPVRLQLLQTTDDSYWRSFGAFSAFLVALFAEMYGFPLTIYFLSGWLQSHYPNVDWFSHDAGHLLEMMFGWKANPHAGPFHILSFVFITAGFLLISAAWKVLYDAQQRGGLATAGPYSYVRHPQYAGFILVMFGFLLQWPTLLTLAMFPVLVTMYVHLARQEERDARAEFGETYDRYAALTPGWFPRLVACEPLSRSDDKASKIAMVRPHEHWRSKQIT